MGTRVWAGGRVSRDLNAVHYECINVVTLSTNQGVGLQCMNRAIGHMYGTCM